jgi:hypothetical protein
VNNFIQKRTTPKKKNHQLLRAKFGLAGQLKKALAGHKKPAKLN